MRLPGGGWLNRQTPNRARRIEEKEAAKREPMPSEQQIRNHPDNASGLAYLKDAAAARTVSA